MAIKIDWQYIELQSGGIEANVSALYPDKSYDDIKALSAQIFEDNRDILYQPFQYEVGTPVKVRPQLNTTTNTDMLATPPQG